RRVIGKTPRHCEERSDEAICRKLRHCGAQRRGNLLVIAEHSDEAICSSLRSTATKQSVASCSSLRRAQRRKQSVARCSSLRGAQRRSNRLQVARHCEERSDEAICRKLLVIARSAATKQSVASRH